MSESYLQDFDEQVVEIEEAERDLQVELEQIATDLEGLAELVAAQAETMETASGGSSGLDDLKSDLAVQLEDELSSWNERWRSDHDRWAGELGEQLGNLHERVKAIADGEEDATVTEKLRRDNQTLQAELQIAKKRAAELYKTIQSQQQLLERGRTIDGELALLRQALELQNQLLASRDVAASADSDPVLEEALDELDEDT
jgi:hypothetical protein